MGFFQNIWSSREIQRLERLCETAPAPSVFIRLAQLYRDGEDEEAAQRILNAGLEAFPENASLQGAHQDAEKVRLTAEKQRILAKLENYPSPILYARLAELCCEEGAYDEAHNVCQRGAREYPDYGGLLTVQARILIAQKHDYATACEYLQQATTAEQYNYQALMLLTEVYLRLGKRPEGHAVLEKVLEFAPGDEQANQWLKDFNAVADRLEKETAHLVSSGTSAGTSAATETVSMETPIEPPVKRTADMSADKHSSGVGTSLGVEIREIKRVEGVQGTILIDPYGLVIASDLPESYDEELTAAMVTNVYRSVQTVSRDLGVGEFEDGIIEAGNGCIHVLGLAQMTMGVFASRETKTGLLHRAIYIFAERVLDLHH